MFHTRGRVVYDLFETGNINCDYRWIQWLTSSRETELRVNQRPLGVRCDTPPWHRSPRRPKRCPTISAVKSAGRVGYLTGQFPCSEWRCLRDLRWRPDSRISSSVLAPLAPLPSSERASLWNKSKRWKKKTMFITVWYRLLAPTLVSKWKYPVKSWHFKN